MKKCAKCKQDKEDNQFALKKNKSGSISVRSACKPCMNESHRARRKNESIGSRESRLLKQKEWNVSNKDKIITLKAKYRFKARMIRLSSIPHDAHITDYVKYMHKVNTAIYDAHVTLWRSNKTLHARWKIKHDMNYVVYQRLNSGIKRLFRGMDIDRTGWFDVLGYSTRELKEHIEERFTDGMGWHNKHEWHIDHVKPLCAFNIQSIYDNEFKECFSLDNLRPLYAKDNFIKYITSDKLLNVNKKGTSTQKITRGK